jgi:hypothetical protein
MFLGIVTEPFIGGHGEHHRARTTVVGDRTRTPVFLDFRSVFARLARKVGETDNILFESHARS